ncbi:MAG: family 10 glycosylhydrolase [Candidatus Omnitrophica bacterium]|nr:family 10 glycosylhydrolase [Candidatus Omnitrophota bacterium]
MNRFIYLVLGFFFVFFPLAFSKDMPPRALFVSVIQDPPVLSSRQEIAKLIDFAKQAQIKILFVQIYYRGQAWFPSEVADKTPYEKYKEILRGDPLALLIRQAHAQGIQVHAWLNLLSLGNNMNANFIKKYGTDVLTRNSKEKNKIEDFKVDQQYFLEPGDWRVREDLAKIVEEIVHAYPNLDGIQFDYIRYPDSDPHYGYTKINIARFKKMTGLSAIDEKSSIWKDFRRAQVTEVLEKMVSIVRARHGHMQVSTTGCMPYVRAFDEAYQDWPSWLSSGLVDFVTIMNYSVDPKQFERWIAQIKTKTRDFSKVKIAVGAYKLVHTPGIFKQEFLLCEKMGSSCVIFHYGSLLENPNLHMFLTGNEQH